MIKNKPPDSTLVYRFEYDDNFIESEGMISQQMSSIQGLLVFNGFPFQLSVLDSLFRNNLEKNKAIISQ